MLIHEKRRGLPEPGSIPEALDIFRAEVRFYQEIAPVIGVRVPACYRAAVTGEGTVLQLEDLSAWQPGADPVAAARLLADLHLEWAGWANVRWPWLRPVGAAIALVADLYDRTWPQLQARQPLPPRVVSLGQRLTGNVADAEYAMGSSGPLTLTHGDASMPNMRTSQDGEIALLDWEDVSCAPGISDLSWLLASSVDPARWDEVIGAYSAMAGTADASLRRAMPAAVVQALLSLSDTESGSPAADAWIARLDAAAARIDTAG